MDESRKQFDEAYERMQYDHFGSNRDFAWKFWQASRTAIDIELPKRIGSKSSWQEGPHMFADDVVSTILAAGIKVKE